MKLIMENWKKYLMEMEEPCKINKACKCVDTSEANISIEEIQKFLKDNNFLASEITGKCDAQTRSAILDFQKQNNLQCDACVGDETHQKMLNLSTPYPKSKEDIPVAPEATGLGVNQDSAPEILIVGDSIAAAMVVAAHKLGFVNEPQCKGKRYWDCVTATAKGGTTSKWARRKLSDYIDTASQQEEQPHKKTMIVSTGTNDALAWARRKQMKSFTPEKCVKEINKIASIAQSAGYKVIFKLLGPITPKDRGIKKRFDSFATEVNKVIVKYNNFSAEGVDYSDYVHPSPAGSEELVRKALL